jgi:hypothetical protein
VSYSNSPAGPNAGYFQLHDVATGTMLRSVPVSGNARQRRRELRILKKQYQVTQFNCQTRAPRFVR